MMSNGTRREVDLPYFERGTGPVVVLVHASNTDNRIWAEHADRLGERFRVIAPTQRYFGTTPWSDDGRDFSVATHARDLARFVSALSRERVTLVGWSYGAAVCLAMAVEQPASVQRLILYEPAIVSFVTAPLEAQAAATDRQDMTAEARRRVGQGDLPGAVRTFMDGVNDQEHAFDSLPTTVQQIMLENGRTLPLLFAAPQPILSCQDLGRLAQLNLVVLQGDSTRTFYKVAAKWATACVPGATLITVPDARHLMPVEDQERFTDLILDLLNRTR